MRSLLFLSGVIVVVAVAAPDILSRYLDRTGPAHTKAEPVAAARPRAVVARQVEVEASRDGHFYVEAEINRQPVRLMVDTGATIVALRESDANAAGIRPRRADYDKPVATANGTAYAAATELDTLAVGEIEIGGVRAMVLPDEQLGISLLGGSFLNRLRRFQVESGTLIFEN